jgi:hypothetical protein
MQIDRGNDLLRLDSSTATVSTKLENEEQLFLLLVHITIYLG